MRKDLETSTQNFGMDWKKFILDTKRPMGDENGLSI